MLSDKCFCTIFAFAQVLSLQEACIIALLNDCAAKLDRSRCRIAAHVLTKLIFPSKRIFALTSASVFFHIKVFLRNKSSHEHGSERYVKHFDVWQHLAVMLYAVIRRF